MQIGKFKTEFAHRIFHQKYAISPNESWDECCRRVVEYVCGTGNGRYDRPLMSRDEQDELVQHMIHMRFIPGGRYLYYSGRPMSFYNNCFALKCEEDTREEWGSLVNRATSCLMSGGGIGVDYSVIRPSGRTLARTGGIASGPLPLMSIVNEIGRNVMQGGSRRSAIWAGLNWQHEDIEQFLHVKDWSDLIRMCKEQDFNFPAPLDMTNISIQWDDHMWKYPLIYNKDYNEDQWDINNPILPTLWYDSVRQMCMTGEPGHSYNFGVHEKEVCRNACVPYDTPILTKSGYIPIGECVGTQIKVWNGDCWSEVTPKYTGEKELVTVNLSDGSSLTCSYNHEFIVDGRGRAEADSLYIGDKLEKYELPVIEDCLESLPVDPYNQGFYAGDGTKNQSWSYVYEPKFMVIPHLIGKISPVYYGEDKLKYRWNHGPMLDKHFVPVNASRKECVYWLSGLLDADGTVLQYKNGDSLQIASTNRQFLLDVQLMLSRLGCKAKVSQNQLARSVNMPDGRGGHKDYNCNPLWRILIGCTDTYNLLGLGLTCKRLTFRGIKPQRDARRFVRVVSIEEAGYDSVYCFNEPINHKGVFNGILTGQCTEFISEHDSDVCNLGSINLGNIQNIDELKSVVSLSSKFLVCGSVRADLPYEKVRKVREQYRKIGLGLMGVHEWLLQRSYKYGVNDELRQWLGVYQQSSTEAATEHSRRLYISDPVRFRAVAPSGTIGILASTTTGIEPLFAVAYKRRYLSSGTKWKYEYIIDATAQRIIEETGCNPEDIETAYRLSETLEGIEKRVEFQHEVQRYVDMGISSTINLATWGSKTNNPDTVGPVAQILAKYASGLRGVTCYPNGSRGGQPLTQVTYEEAHKHRGLVFEEEFTKGCVSGTCGI